MQKINKNLLSILHLTNNYRPYCSGVANSLDQLHRQLLAIGHKSNIVTLDFLGNNETEKNVIRLFSPIRFTYNKNPMAIPLLPYREVKNIIQHSKPDLVHVHHPFLLGKIGLDVAQKYQIPVVFTYHTQYEKYVHYIPLPEMITQPIVLKLVHDFCNKVDGIIAPSQTIKEAIEKYSAKPIQVIPSGIDQIFFGNVSKKIGKKPLQLLSVSRFVKEKNIEFLLHVMQSLSVESSLTLVGYGAHEEFLRFYAFQKLGLKETQIKFCIKPTKDELQEQYKQADFFIFASTTETQGLVLAEAMACGTPVIAVDAIGSRDIIKNGHNGFLVTHEEEMCKAIAYLNEHHDEYQNFSKNAWYTAQNYRAEILAKKVTAFYEAIIANRKSELI
jgi:glycosyltransferase involved in cell wall biosynthesis